jgi:hypothetical protein
MMKLALLRNNVRHLAGHAISTPRQARALRTCSVVMRKAQQSGGEDKNLPATTERGGAGTSLGFPGLGLSSPFASRFREMEQEMEVSFCLIYQLLYSCSVLLIIHFL